MTWVDWLGANIAWILLVAIAVMAVAWVALSRARSRRWGHPTEFAGSMPPAESRAHVRLRERYERGEITWEEFQRLAQSIDTGRE